MNLLLADQDTDLLDLLAFVFVRDGYSVQTATDGEQALAWWQAGQPDLVLLDVDLPKVDGFEVCRRIRRECATPVILLGARRDEVGMVRTLLVGADDYVAKPFHHQLLVARVRCLLRRLQGGSGAEPVAPVWQDVDSSYRPGHLHAVPA